jgi:hypothetical protein
MNDAQRYRLNAVECLSAAKRCEPPYRGLTLAIAESWLSLARQHEAMDGLLGKWSEAGSVTSESIKPDGRSNQSSLLSCGLSYKTTFSSELWTFRAPLYSMNPSLRNLFMNALTRDRVVPTISASVS